MADLLYLAHRLPYPPDKGEKIRAYHALSHLAERFNVHLGCFSDDPVDRKHVPQLQRICASACIVPLDPAKAIARGALGMARGASLSEYYFHDASLSRWVTQTLDRFRPECIFVYSSAMAPYAMPYASSFRVILDMVDVDSEKWRTYGMSAPWPVNRLYRRESRKLFALERAAATAFERSFFVSQAERDAFLELAPETGGRVGYYNNGVDLDHFNPALDFANPFVKGQEAIVFTGTMNYGPNIESVRWFAREVLPRIRRCRDKVEFWIVGANPVARVSRLGRLASVHVTGRVPDVRPYLAHAACVVAPLKIARGVQNKILEAMAMARPIVATHAAHEGISALAEKELLVAESPEAFADAVVSVLEGKHGGLGRKARSRVEADYDWTRNLQPLDRLFRVDTVRENTIATLAE